MEVMKQKASKAMPDFDQAIEKYHQALREFVKGNPEPNKLIFSHRDDVTLANPLGPPGKGWKQVSQILDNAASLLRDGDITNFDNIVKYTTPDLAFILEIEYAKAKVTGKQDVSKITLRVTTIFRPENGTWKVLHRHADPIVSPRPVESAIQV